MGQEFDDLASATVRRWQLTEGLRQLREQRELTIDDVMERLRDAPGRWSRSKLSRVETREQRVKPHEVEQLLDAYEVTDEDTRTWLVDLAATAHRRGHWLSVRKDLPEDFHNLLSVEPALVARRQFETMVVPGLLQTADYTRALIHGINPGITHETVERRVLARMARQHVLARPVPLRLHVVLDEAILERQVGPASVMRNQLQRLADTGSQEHITVQILPRSVGVTPALLGPFSLLTLPDPIPDFGYTEGPGGAIYIEDRAAVRVCTERWGILTGRALPASDSLDAIKRAVKTYDQRT
ncbi:helix-turn-helix transcriptional regulator [Saccharothrix violaceirubra]|uniref:Transcriptional regulator with XRE-family HTH domain n=1 Tax=Saccharothrix violaceirubra TaxID=413306 RepID=A0A7W7T6V6_9PSEU|nr:helix-turn-helix transcriptional regulator [Saccharothrix violaceirubra]MBB4967421.1 transcriptional regulator with XRE-family HTH domain [Saccharothrix violaceirubra]